MKYGSPARTWTSVSCIQGRRDSHYTTGEPTVTADEIVQPTLLFFLSYYSFCTGSGEIDFDEFLQLMAAKQANMSMEDELRNAFNVFDSDSSGYISSDELKQVTEIKTIVPVKDGVP